MQLLQLLHLELWEIVVFIKIDCVKYNWGEDNGSYVNMVIRPTH